MRKNRVRHIYNVLIKSISIGFLMILLSTPIIISGIYPKGEFSESWIGFWGSFSGGILGTLGVIYVAHIQSEQHRKLNEDSMAEQRSRSMEQIQSQIDSMKIVKRNNKERLKIETRIDLLREYNKNLHKINKI